MSHDHDRSTTDPAQSTSSPATFAPGDLLCDRFRVVRFIARGGMGEVYEAEDLELNERVAVKAIRPDIARDERIHHWFRREVQLARKVTHPNICRIFDLFQHSSRDGESTVFVTMELLEGETLAQVLRKRRREGSRGIAVADALPIVRQMCDALAAAHAAGVVHRDFKTNNVMLMPGARPSDPARVVVTDFGLAYSVSDAGVSAAAPTIVAGEVFGTPDYMAPEQIEGGDVTTATDVYALGIVLYEMVTGVRPFASETPMATALRRVTGPQPTPPRELVADLPVAWNATIMRCLARYPQNRFAEIADVVRALDGQPAGGAHRVPRAAVAAAAVAAVIVVGAGLLWYRGAGPGTNVADAPASPSAAASTTPLPARRSVAVLGFRNLAAREDMQWLSTAFAEMLTTELGAGNALRTIPGENVNRMAMELGLANADSYGSETLARIRQNLGSDIVVFGSYVAVGTGGRAEIRLDIRMQEPGAGETVAVVSETGTVDGLLDLVAKAGGTLREKLRVEALPATAVASVRATLPSSPVTAQLYADGLNRLRRFDALGAQTILERAVTADPQFPLAHSALARAWSALGYDARAQAEAQKAFELAGSLPRADRLAVEATYRELSSGWAEAIRLWQTLSTFFPDDVEYVLHLADAQIASGAPKDAVAAVARFRQQFPAVTDPRLDLAEAAAAETLSDFSRTQAAARAAAAAAKASGATLLVAAANMREATAVLRQGHTEAAVALFEESRRRYADAGDKGGEARALNGLGGALADGPEAPRAIALYEEGLRTARAVGEKELTARLLNNLAIQKRRAGDLLGSLRMNQESLAIRREIGDRTNEATSLNNIGNVLLDLGDLTGAVQHYQQSAAMCREIGDRRGLARALYNASEALRLQGDLAGARNASNEALEIRRRVNEPATVASSLFGVASIALLQGDFTTAARLNGESLTIVRSLNLPRQVGYSLYLGGDIAFAQGKLPEAQRLHQEALALRTQSGEKLTAAESRVALGMIALEEERPAEAEPLLREAAAIFDEQKAPASEAGARALLGVALAQQGKRPAAERETARARTLGRNQQNVLLQMPLQINAARVDALRDPAAARRALDAVRATADRLGMPRFQLEARRALVEIDQRTSPTAAAASRDALRADARRLGFGLFDR